MGLVCSCGWSVETLKNFSSLIKEHVRTAAHATFWNEKDTTTKVIYCTGAATEAAFIFKTLAVQHAAATGAGVERHKSFLERFLEPAEIKRCRDCLAFWGQGKKDRMTHIIGCSKQSGLVISSCFIPILWKTNRGGFEPIDVGYDPTAVNTYAKNYYPYYASACAQLVEATQQQPPPPPALPPDPFEQRRIRLIQGYSQAHPGNPIIAPIVQPHQMFHQDEIDLVLVNSFRNGVTTFTEDEMAEQLYYHEKEFIAQQGACQATLIAFADEVYKPVAMEYFRGSWRSMGACLTGLVGQATLKWEHAILEVTRQAFDRLYKSIDSINTNLRTDICLVGKWRQINTMRQLRARASNLIQVDGGGGDDADDPMNGWSADEMQMVVEGLLKLVQEDGSEGIPRKLDKLAEGTTVKYRSVLQKYVLFLGRLHQFNGGIRTRTWFEDEVKPMLEDDNLFTNIICKEKAIGTILVLVLGSLRFEDKGSYGDMVSKKPTDAGLFCMARGIDEALVDGKPLFRNTSPYSLHWSAAGLLYTLRLFVCGAMVHAFETKDVQLQRRLSDPKVMACCRTTLDLAHLMRVAKAYEVNTSHGMDPAMASKSSPDREICDFFSIKNPTTGQIVRTSQLMLQVGTRRILHQLEESVICMLQPLREMSLRCFDVDTTQLITLPLAVEANWNAVVEYLITNPAEFIEPGRSHLFVQPTRKRDSNIDADYAKPMYASTLAARFRFRLENGKQYIVESRELADLLVKALQADASYRLLFDQHNRLCITAFGTLFQYIMRGAPRQWEILMVQTGITNRFSTDSMTCDLATRALGTDLFSDRIFLSFGRRKYGGANSNSTGFMALPEQIGLLFGIYLSIFRTAAALYIDKDENYKDKAMIHSLVCKFYIEFSLSTDQIMIKEWDSISASVERYFEQMMGLAADTMTLAMMRQVMCSISSVLDTQDKELKRVEIDKLRARGFNHGVGTHMSQYSEGATFGAVRVARPTLEKGLAMDKQHASYMAQDGYSGRNGNSSIDEDGAARSLAMPVYRHLRLVTDQEAFGLVKFFGCIGYASQSPIQRNIVTECASAVRDAMFTYRCGSGKSLAIWAFAAMAYGSFLFSLPPEEQTSTLANRLMDNPNGPPVLSGEAARQQATVILNDADVKLFKSFCETDPSPLPVQSFAVVMVPYRSVGTELVSELNEKQGVRAIHWDENTVLNTMLLSVESKGSVRCEPFSFDVVVMTVSKAAMVQTRIILEEADNLGVISNWVFDEAHTGITNMTWMLDMTRVRDIRRKAPLYGLSGTLQKALEIPWGQTVHSRVGQISLEALNSSRPGKLHAVQYARQGGTGKLVTTWRATRGIYRDVCTVSPSIAHVLVDVGAISDDQLCAKAVLAAVGVMEENGPIKAIRVMIMCATTAQVDKTSYHAKSNPTLARLGVHVLVGGVSQEDMDRVNAEWTRGGSYLLIASTVASHGINNTSLNVAILMTLYYGVQTLYQAIARVSRKGQKSAVIFLHRDSDWKRAGERLSEFHFVEHNVLGMDINDPQVRRALTADSMSGYVECPADGCLWETLRREMDGTKEGIGEESLDPFKDPNWCCGNCNHELKEWARKCCAMPDIMARVVTQQRRLAHQQQPATAAPRNERRVASLGGQAVSAQRPRLVSMDYSHRARGTEESWVRALVRARGNHAAVNQAKCCVWHKHIPNLGPCHKTMAENVWSIGNCRKSFCIFIGAKRNNACFKCGGDTNLCCKNDPSTSRIQCQLGKFTSIIHCPNFCTRCGVFGSVGEKHHVHTDCPNDRVWGLAIWALRSIKGYKLVEREWRSDIANTKVIGEFPEMVPFGRYDEDLVRKWNRATTFILSSPTTNYLFWKNVRRALLKSHYIIN